MSWEIVLIVLLAVCAFGWLNQYVCNAALIMCLMARGGMPPEDEVKKNLDFAWKQVLKIK